MTISENEINLVRLRRLLEQNDQELLRLVGKRCQLVLELGDLKSRMEMPVLQPGYWEQSLARRIREARDMDLSETLTEEIFNLLHRYSVQLQQNQRHESES